MTHYAHRSDPDMDDLLCVPWYSLDSGFGEVMVTYYAPCSVPDMDVPDAKFPVSLLFLIHVWYLLASGFVEVMVTYYVPQSALDVGVPDAKMRSSALCLQSPILSGRRKLCESVIVCSAIGLAEATSV
ncbi:hypothetical protein Salat_2029100 [Sesamum alatum]|uniref:Uncharacterized protein n=1 Tax=Sesamum alatum TaxID=300844 RepID=A0AAE2CFY5_9LAMI|nr:hypothetical protein Salat_2029100 [Sesamum alatum]